jgi:TRAP-type C4-dicarboxylate transport system permease small subunit
MSATNGNGGGRASGTWVSAVADKLESGLNFLLAAMLAVLVVCLCYQVFGRYVLDDAPSWTEEVARFLVVYITMVGTAVIIRNDGHITVNVLVSALPERVRVWVFWVRDAIVLAAAGILIWYGYGLALIGGHRRTPALEISMYWPFIAIPISGILMAFFLFVWRIEQRGQAEAEKEII